MGNYTKINNLLVVDPNPCGEGSIALEDLSISVELKVISRLDDIIISDKTDDSTYLEQAGTEGTTISFINSSGDKKTHLTTHYTELTTKFNQNNPDLETLGIESIDISFNTSYVPIVKIKFRDIRGRLFEQGNDSPYAFLFRMPYPVFKLTVKGYYGKPVTYVLHMTKFSSSLDNNTGSYIISCDFIGYTYAFLTDILMGYIKAIPFTTYGKKYIEDNNDFISFDELKIIIDKLEKEIIAYKHSDKQLASLTIFTDLISKLEEIEKLLIGTLDSYVNNISATILKSTSVVGADKIAFLNSRKPLTDVEANAYDETVLVKVESYKKFNEDKKTDNFDLDIKYFKLDNDGVYYDNVVYSNIVENDWAVYQSFSDSEKIGNFTKIENDKDNLNSEIEEYYNQFKDLLTSEDFKTLKNIKLEDGTILDSSVIPFKVVDFKRAIIEINKKKAQITEEYNTVKAQVQEDFTTRLLIHLQSKGINFDPSIGEIFKILCEHVDLFLKSIRDVGEEVKKLEGSETRKLGTIKSGRLPDYPNDNGLHVKAFPEYLENDVKNGAFVDKWIGNNVNFIGSPEVNYINELYEAIIKSGREDADYLARGSAEDWGWYPVNAFDTKVISDNVINPWEIDGNANEKIIYKLLIERMSIFLGYSNKELDPSEIVDMATIEAKQSFNGMKNAGTKLGIITGDINNDRLINKINFINNSNINNYNLTYKGTGNKYTYTTPIESVYDPTSEIYEFLSITQSKNDLHSKPNPLYLLTPEQRKANTEIFTSRLVSGDDDNGETFIKIIDKVGYENSLKYESFTLKNPPKTDKVRLTQTISKNVEIKDFNHIYGGVHATHEFMEYENDANKVFYEFYEQGWEVMLGKRKGESKFDTFNLVGDEYEYNENVKPCNSKGKVLELRAKSAKSSNLRESLINKVKNRNDEFDFRFEPTFTTNIRNYSLFGSDFYNSQTINEAKAFLFLHTIPFEGMGTEGNNENGEFGILESKIKNFFNQRSGIIEVPYSWILFLGGLLYRASRTDGTDIISFTSADGSYPLVPGFDGPIGTTNYLNTSTQNFTSGGNLNFNYTSNLTLKPNSQLQSISNILQKLPKSVKDEFILEFQTWAKGGFIELQADLEIFNNSVTLAQRQSYHNDLSSALTSPTSNIKASAKDNYSVISTADEDAKVQTNFFLELRDDGDATTNLLKFLDKSKLIINGTYRIWDAEISNDYQDIVIRPNDATLYLNTYLTEFRKLNIDVKPDDDDITQTLFNSTKVDDIKLKLYKNIKSIYDKWLVGVKASDTELITNDLFKRFLFIDRSYTDISTLFKISPTGLAEHLTKSTNVSFYNFIARILSDNNFDFHPLPTFIDFSSAKEVSEVFKPIPFNEAMEIKSGPQFVCMYIGERSSKLDITEKHGINKNDGWKINTICSGGELTKATGSKIPIDFEKGTKSIPYFLVKYGDQNQSLFKSIKVDQAEFTETDEGLQIIEDLSHKNRNHSVGQNLFDIYSNRSYSAEIDMLGCAQIQPFMYFQLDNVPMFTGAYTIINTRHHIKPNHMTTSFKGVRVRYGKTKMVDAETLYLHLIGNLDDVDNKGIDYTDTVGTPLFNFDESKPLRVDDTKIVDEVLVNTINPPFKSKDRNLSKINTVVLHWTAGASISNDVTTLKTKGYGYHFLIDSDGTVFQGAALNKKVSHAGESYGPNGKYVNGHSIGISFSKLGTPPNDQFSDNDYQVCADLIKQLKIEVPTLKYITGHHWISPGRKIDPYTLDFTRLRSMVGGDLELWKTGDAPYPSGLVGTEKDAYSKAKLSQEVSNLSFTSDLDTE